MHNKKLIIAIIIITASITGIIMYKTMQQQHALASLKIGILQTASHPALDAARQGFIDTLQKALGSDVECVVRNAEGSITNAHTIAQHFHADNSINAIYAIATPALQAIASVEKEKPIFIAAVTDPHALGIMSEKTNICGMTDMIDIPREINAIQQILPNVRSIAIIYNPSEANSVTQVSIMDKELKRNNIDPIRVGVISETDIPQAIASALSKADALLTPTDNVIASAMPLISHLALDARKPLIASHNPAVEQGALMARGVDYYTSGQQTGSIALTVLRDGKKPYEIPIKPTTSDTLVINKNVAEQLNIMIPRTTDKIVYVSTAQ